MVEHVGGAPTTRGSAGAGTVSSGNRLVVITEDEEIKGYVENSLVWTYSSAANFKTEIDAELDSLGTGGAVSDVRIWPRQLAGEALSEIERHTS